MWETFIDHLSDSVGQVLNTAQLFYQGMVANISIMTILDVALVFAFLWWIYKRLRRTDLIKIFPRLFLLLILMLLARMVGLWVLFYLSTALLVVVLIALGALYAPEIKRVLETDVKPSHVPLPKSAPSTAEVQTAIKILVESFSVLSKAKKPALVVVQSEKSLNRLIEPSAKMQMPLSIDVLIDFFGNGSKLAQGAIVVEGCKVIAGGSKLGQKKKLFFNADDPHIKRIAKDFGATFIIANKTTGELSVVDKDNVYKHLTAKDLSQVLQTALIYSSK